jgi:RNA polymerase sigma-70 factor, ECF subfamily
MAMVEAGWCCGSSPNGPPVDVTLTSQRRDPEQLCDRLLPGLLLQVFMSRERHEATHPEKTPPAAQSRRASTARVTGGRYGSSQGEMRYGEEAQLIAGLRAGEELAFVQLVDNYGASLIRLARLYVRDRAVVQEVVQETWIGVLRGIDRFEGRSSLRTWLFRILTNVAKTRAAREARSVPFSALEDEVDEREPSVPANRFQDAGAAWPGHWDWAMRPKGSNPPLDALLSAETRDLIERAIEDLPAMQRRVVALRDVEGWSAREVCDALDLSEANQRVLLHRGRTRVREAIQTGDGGGLE